ncbi:uncharacterized protein PRCAT00000680001 [Priceomyces carsonii]|uniref:uncharacterized protein n=1 Tax=Priceomyces carsonii TaxID=28549 RepID=UPI002ED83FA6|nr:unnamed protein product [Priceomyces carsonii]
MSYNEVNTSLKLGERKNSDKSEEEPKAPLGTVEWPKSLQDFAKKSFRRANESLNEKEKVVFNDQLQKLIEEAFNREKLWENNWDLQKIPILDGVQSVELYCNKAPSVEVSNNRRSKSTANSKRDVQDMNYDSNERKRQRMERFANLPGHSPSTPNNGNTSGNVIVGKSTDLEKRYLRLTSEPNPQNVRPQNTLTKSIKFVLNKYEENKRYSYIIDQLKSIRQDLTVQHIKNDFTIYIYETNAKISLQNDDLGEFNQCQSQLKYLYYLKRKQDHKYSKRFYGNELEFLIYRMIYMIVMNNYSEIYKIKLKMKEFEEFKKTKTEKDLLKVVEKLFELNENRLIGNFYKVFEIIDEFRRNKALALGYKLIKESLFNKEVIKSLFKISKSYKKVPTSFLVSLFRLRDVQDLEDFLKKNKLEEFLLNSTAEFDCVSSRHSIAKIIGQFTFNKIDIKGQV